MYLRLLRLPGVGRVVLSGLLARVPLTMVFTAQPLLVQRATGSFAAAGAASAAYGVSSAVFGPVLGRLVDRAGQSPVLVPTAVLFPGSLVALVALAHGHAPTWALPAVSAVVGGTVPPVAGAIRALWPSLVEGTDVPPTTAFALESVTIELFFIAGPLLAGLLIALASPATAILAAAGLAFAGTLAFASAPAVRAWRPSPAVERHLAGALRSRGMVAVAVSLLPFGAAFGVLDVALPAFAVDHGSPGATGVLWAAQAAGSAAGGLWYGARAHAGRLERRYAALLALFAAGLAPPVAAGSLPVLSVLVALGGLFLAPTTACAFELVDRLAREGTRTEAYTWGVTANLAGSAAGAGAAGPLVQRHGSQTGFGLAVALAGGAALVAAAWQRRLAGEPEQTPGWARRPPG